MAKRSNMDLTALVLVLVGGVNWGLVGLWNLDLVQRVLGAWPTVAKIVYILIGLSALYMIYCEVKQ